MKISVIGTGYVGLVAGACFAESGHTVTCVDNQKHKIDALNAGKIPIYEPGLEEMVERNRKRQRLIFTTDLAAAVQSSRAVFICVGTPADQDGSADLRYVLGVAAAIAENIREYTVIVDKSTVPVGTAEKVQKTVASKTKVPFDVVSNPEFLKEGAAVEDFLKPDRIVIGTGSERARAIMLELYAPFTLTNQNIQLMDSKSAEMTKYAANAMLATRISFMNEIANLCDAVGADVDEVRRGIGSDSRIGKAFLFPGIGYGGSCFPKDVQALVKTARDQGVPLQILDAVEAVNFRQKRLLFQKISRHYGSESLKGRHFALWGLAFKARTDDMREASSLVLIEQLLAAGASVCAYDPEAVGETQKMMGDRIRYAANPYDALQGADALCVVTEWHEFRFPEFEVLKARLKQPVIFDGRNLYKPVHMQALGFTYISIGRGLL